MCKNDLFIIIKKEILFIKRQRRATHDYIRVIIKKKIDDYKSLILFPLNY